MAPADMPIFIGDANDTATILADAAAFDARYTANFGAPDDEAHSIAAEFAADQPLYWDIGQKTSALVQMYDLLAPIDSARACRYLERLHEIADVLLANRDDHRLRANGRHPVDSFRGRVMPAWGGFADDREGRWNTDVSTSGLFAYAMAAFARRVADDRGLHARYGADAIRFTTGAIETYNGFLNEQHLAADDPQAYFEVPDGYRTLACRDGSCNNYRISAGYPLAYNENLSMMKALAETALAADSQLYRNSADANPLFLFIATDVAPQLIAKNFTYFDKHLRPDEFHGAPIFWWNHQQEIPGVKAQIQDTSHAQFELGSLAVLLDDKIRLNALLASHGHHEEVALSSALFVRFANTFLRRIWTAQNLLYPTVKGSDGPGDLDNSHNNECAGWIPLAQFDRWVWIRCRDTTFLASDFLRVDNHAALLRYRQFIH
jgi:hypothetical protein